MNMVVRKIKADFECLWPYLNKLLWLKIALQCIIHVFETMTSNFFLKVLLIKANWCSIMVKMTPSTFEEYQNESYILVIEDYDIALTPISFWRPSSPREQP